MGTLFIVAVAAPRTGPFNDFRDPFNLIRFIASPSIEDVSHFLITFFSATFASFLASPTTLNLNKFMKSSAFSLASKRKLSYSRPCSPLASATQFT